jgi:hypothetical protein
MRALPFPGLRSLARAEGVVYLPLIAVGWSIAELVRGVVQPENSANSGAKPDPVTALLIVFTIMTAPLLLKGMVRVSPVHMLLAIVPALVVIALLVDRCCRRSAASRVLAVAVSVLTVVPTYAVARPFLVLHLHRDSLGSWIGRQVGLMRPLESASDACETGPASGLAELDPDYARIANYVAAHSRPDEPVLIALDRHDRTLANPVALYFASGRLPRTHWHHFDPGLQSRADVQSAMIADIKRNKVRLIVRDASYDGIVEPNDSAKSSGVRLLDAYIDANYREVAAAGKIAVWLANTDLGVADRPAGSCQPLPVPSDAVTNP